MKVHFSITRSKEMLSGVFLLLIVVLILVNIFFRAVLNKPLIWSVELSSVFIIWSVYAVFGVIYQEKKHLNVNIIDKYLIGKIRQKLDIFTDVVIVIIVIFCAYSSIGAMERNINVRTAALDVQVIYIYYLPFLLGCVSMFYYVIKKYAKIFKDHKNRDGE